MPNTLSTLDEFRQHPVVQALADAYQAQYHHTQDAATHSTAHDRDEIAIETHSSSANRLPHPTQSTEPHTTEHQLPAQQGHTLWLACSGGRDSLGLAFACHLLSIPIHVIHINHQLQADAPQWQARVTAYAQRWSLPYECVSVSLPNASELAARQARFEALFAHMHHGDSLLLGHHADDQAETVLMNLCKGAGLTGLSGMAAISQRLVDDKQLTLWRPWLAVTRAQITEFCTRAGLDFVDDPTNLATGDDANTRAFLRTQVFPPLAQQWPQVTANIARAASIVAEANAILVSQTQDDITHVQGDTLAKQILPVTALLTLPVARQLRVIAHWMQGDAVYAPPRAQVLHVQQLANTQNTEQQTQLHWHDIVIRRYRDQLYRLPCDLPVATAQQVSLAMHDTITLASGTWQVVPASVTASGQPSAQDGLPVSWLQDTLCLRPRRLGERLHVRGRVGSWSVKKFFQSVQVAPWQRDQADIIEVAGTVVALVCAAGFFPMMYNQPSDTTTTLSEHGWRLQLIR